MKRQKPTTDEVEAQAIIDAIDTELDKHPEYYVVQRFPDFIVIAQEVTVEVERSNRSNPFMPRDSKEAVSVCAMTCLHWEYPWRNVYIPFLYSETEDRLRDVKCPIYKITHRDEVAKLMKIKI